MAANVSTQNAQLKTMIEGIARQVAKDEIATALRNLRPGGLTPVACTIVAPAADLVVPACHIDIPFPGFLQSVTFRSAEVGSATLDVTKRRETQTFAQALSIFGGVYPSIVGATDAQVPLVQPVPVAWEDWIEADSTLYFYLRTCSGFLSLTINLWIRATSSA